MRMMSITLCDGGSACLPATTIGWQNKGEGSFERTTLPVADGIPDDYLVHGAGDFNGDGLTDLYLNLSQGNGRAYPSDTSRPAQVWLSKGDGTFERKILPVADGMPDDYLVHGSGDFNGDGLTDFYINLSQDNGRAYPSDTSRPAQVWLSKGDGTFEKKILPVADGMPDDYRVYSSGDFNGDGLTDLYLHFSHSNGRAAGTPNYSRQSEIWLSKGDGTFDREILPVADSMPNEYQVHSSGDFNGDGLTDEGTTLPPAGARRVHPEPGGRRLGASAGRPSGGRSAPMPC
jgi:hypothetical protein